MQVSAEMRRLKRKKMRVENEKWVAPPRRLQLFAGKAVTRTGICNQMKTKRRKSRGGR